MVDLIDKRITDKDKTTENRQRFLRRVKGAIKDQIPDIIKDRSLKDIDKTGGTIRVKRKSIKEPTFHNIAGGERDIILPGNDEFVVGDQIQKPYNGNGSGRGDKSGSGESEDDFVIELSREEFLKYFFEDLELPDMMESELARVKETIRQNAGFQPDGSPNRLNLVRSYKHSLARRIPIRNKLQKQIERLLKLLVDETISDELVKEYELEIIQLQKKLNNIPLFEEFDLKYRCVLNKEITTTHATMIMVMDNSGSMGKKEKTIARKFFWLLYSFLRKQYDDVDMRFISHTEEAEELNEHEFFNTSVSGGTLVSSALEIVDYIVNHELVGKTNIYIAQVSDGDNMDSDNLVCKSLLENEILNEIRYYAYLQVDQYHDDFPGQTPLSYYTSFGKGLWNAYQEVSKNNKKLQCKRVSDESEIYPVFHELFKKK